MALGITAIIQGVSYLSAQSGSFSWSSFVAITAIVAGFLMMLGVLTPIVGALLFLGGAAAIAFSFSNSLQTNFAPMVYEIVLSASVALLGPGAFSVDAGIFGRREIIIADD